MLTNKTEKVQEFELMQRMGKAFYASGMFPDLKSEAQAIVKVMVGKELGLPPFSSITGIHVVNGKPVIGANLIATMIAQHPKYAYRILKSTKEICEIQFHDEGTKVGNVSFTIQEAQEAGLLGKDNWKKYAADMLFARAISRGAKRYTPGIFGGAAVYTPDEMNIDADEDGVIDHKEIEAVKKLDKGESILLPGVEVPWLPKSHPVPFPPVGFPNPIPGSDEAIIEEIKKTHVISDGGF